MILGLIIILVPQALSVNLKDYDSEKYDIAVKINNSPAFTKGKVDFLVCYNPFTILIKAHTLPLLYPNKVFLYPKSYQNSQFDIVIAHELGHLEYRHHTGNTERAQTESDRFAVRIVGKKSLRDYRISQGFSKDHYLIKNL